MKWSIASTLDNKTMGRKSYCQVVGQKYERIYSKLFRQKSELEVNNGEQSTEASKKDGKKGGRKREENLRNSTQSEKKLWYRIWLVNNG